MFLYSTVSSPSDRSTPQPLADLSITRYSFVQLSELGRRGENENAQAATRAYSIESPAFYGARAFLVKLLTSIS